MGDFRVSRAPATPPCLQFPTFSLTRAHWLLHVFIHMGLCRQGEVSCTVTPHSHGENTGPQTAGINMYVVTVTYRENTAT